MEAPLRPDEDRRLITLRDYGLDLSSRQPQMQKVARLAKSVFNAPMAAVSIVDEERQWFIGRHGIEQAWTDRCDSFCAHAVYADEPLYVEDARTDGRFRKNALVTGRPWIVTYVGSPLHSPDGLPLGTLCVIYNHVRPVSEREIGHLTRIAGVASDLLHCIAVSREIIRPSAGVSGMR
jgi:GAF domain-containing protein